jgi:hypothetical protein
LEVFIPHHLSIRFTGICKQFKNVHIYFNENNKIPITRAVIYIYGMIFIALFGVVRVVGTYNNLLVNESILLSYLRENKHCATRL